MFLSMQQVKKNVAWLMDRASPPVRYLTARRLVDPSPGPKTLTGLWRAVETCADAQEIFGKQKKDGSWCAGGSWALKPSYEQKGRAGGYDPESPKYVTAIWVLPLLGDMGFTAADARVRSACEYILSYREIDFYHRIFNDPSFRPDFETSGLCGRFFQRLVAFGKAGFTEDERVRRGYRAICEAQRDDGGWASQGCIDKNGWTRSCPFSSYHATLALYCSGKEEFRGPLVTALEFLVCHLSLKKPEEISRFFFHGHSTVHELVMLSDLKVGLGEKPVGTILEWLKTMYREDENCFRYDGKPVSKFSRRADGMDSRVAKYRLYHLIEPDWLTYSATVIGANLLKP